MYLLALLVLGVFCLQPLIEGLWNHETFVSTFDICYYLFLGLLWMDLKYQRWVLEMVLLFLFVISKCHSTYFFYVDGSNLFALTVTKACTKVCIFHYHPLLQ